MKIEILLNNEEALKALSAVDLSDSQIAWDLSIEIEEAEKHILRFKQKQDELVKKFGEPEKDNPERYTIKDLKGFSEEVNKLAAVDVKINFPSVALSLLNGSPVSPANLTAWRSLKIITKK